MEYYDSINKTEMYEFYFNKSNRLLLNENVLNVLDTNTINFKENNDLKLFKIDPYQIVRTNRRISKSISEKDMIMITNMSTKSNEESAFYDRTFTEGNDMRRNFKLNSYGMERQMTISDFKSKKNENKILCKNIVKDEVNNLDKKMDKMELNINLDMTKQKDKFEEMKKRKLEDQNNKSNVFNFLTILNFFS
jgi:hypothetical protein